MSGNKSGFALVAVIWLLGLIGLLMTSVIIAASWRIRSAVNVSYAVKAEALADGILQLAISNIRESVIATYIENRNVKFCVIPAEGLAAISFEDEAGKVDLNMASDELIRTLLTATAIDATSGSRSVQELLKRRRSGRADGSLARGEGRFRSIFEIDQVPGVDQRSLQVLIPLITIYSNRSGIDPSLAHPALLAALSGTPFPQIASSLESPYSAGEFGKRNAVSRRFIQEGNSGVILVHSEVLLTSGMQMAARQLIVDMHDTSLDRPQIREFRRGRPRYSEQLHKFLNGASRSLTVC